MVKTLTARDNSTGQVLTVDAVVVEMVDVVMDTGVVIRYTSGFGMLWVGIVILTVTILT